jgi:hypothetical protein
VQGWLDIQNFSFISLPTFGSGLDIHFSAYFINFILSKQIGFFPGLTFHECHPCTKP